MKKEQLKEAVGELNCVDTVFEADGKSYIDTAVSVMQVYDLIDQLDEPEKVAVPQFVADTIDEFTGYEHGDRPGENSVFNFIDNLKGDFGNGYHKKTKEWYRESLQNQIDIERAWLDGYEIEKEKLYYIELIKGSRYVAQASNGVLGFSHTVRMSGTYGDKVMFTQQEIAAIDPRFWQFAVEVAE